MKTIEEIVIEIFNSAATNGKSHESIENGVRMIEEHISEMSDQLESANILLDAYRKAEMKKYIVSLVVKKLNSDGSLNILNDVYKDVEAKSKEDAFGICYDKNKQKLPNHDLHTKLVIEQ